MRLAAALLIALGAVVFASSVAFMVLTLTWTMSFDADAAASGFTISFTDGSPMVSFAVAGYLVAAAGSSLAPNTTRELKSRRTAADV